MNDPNESFVTTTNSIETQGMNNFFGNFMTGISSIMDLEQKSEVTTYTQAPTSPNTLNTTNDTQIQSLYFDGSKSQEGVGVACVLIDPTCHKTFIACRLEFECTNNTAKYKALVWGLKKSNDLQVKYLKVFGDSEIIV